MSEDKLNIKIGESIKRCRISKKITLEDAARRLNATVKELVEMEKGMKYINSTKLFQIANSYGTTVVSLLKESKKTVNTNIKKDTVIMFKNGDDYLINEVFENYVSCTKIDVYNDCKAVDAKEHTIMIDDLEISIESEESYLFNLSLH